MATTIKLKNSVTTTNAPSSLAQGEVAINVTDKKVWVGNAATTPVQLLGTGSDGSFTNISVSGVASFADGTVSLPAITNIGDTNTGIYFPAADTIAFSEGGTESMRITSAGNVGIGTSSPAEQLTVNAASRAAILATGGTVANYFTADSASGGGFVGTGSSHPLSFITSSAERMKIDSSGNVGIGTSSPAQKLHVNGGVLLVEKATAGSTLIVKNDSQNSGQGGQIQLTNTFSGATNPNKYLRVGDNGTFGIINSAYSQSIFDVTDAGVANAIGGYQKNGVNIVSFAFADVTVTGLTTSYQEILITLPNSTVFTSVVSIVPVTGINDIVYLQGIALGEWSGVQALTQARLIIKLGNAVASTSCTVRVYYRV